MADAISQQLSVKCLEIVVAYWREPYIQGVNGVELLLRRWCSGVVALLTVAATAAVWRAPRRRLRYCLNANHAARPVEQVLAHAHTHVYVPHQISLVRHRWRVTEILHGIKELAYIPFYALTSCEVMRAVRPVTQQTPHTVPLQRTSLHRTIADCRTIRTDHIYLC